MPGGGKVAVFGPHPMLSITIESLPGVGGDDIHLHPAGQGVWVARMAAELGAEPILCGFIGGETGTVLRPLLECLPVELRLIEIAAANGCYLHDRRSGERVPVAQSVATAPSRHEIDELFSSTVAAALDSTVLALCGPFPGEALPLEIYGSLVADVKANGTRPSFERGSREGCGDSMMGALAACIAAGLDWEDTLRISAAAGAANFLRHGLGSGSREVVEDLARRVELRLA